MTNSIDITEIPNSYVLFMYFLNFTFAAAMEPAGQPAAGQPAAGQPVRKPYIPIGAQPLFFASPQLAARPSTRIPTEPSSTGNYEPDQTGEYVVSRPMKRPPGATSIP